MFRLVLATTKEENEFNLAYSQSGLPSELEYLKNDPLAQEQRKHVRGHDHVHLSVPSTNPTLVQWWGRAASGYHYPIGQVMKIVDTLHE